MTWTRFSRDAAIIGQYLMFGIFAYAGIDKLVNNLKFTASLLQVDYLPESWVLPIALLLPLVEILIAMTGLVTSFTRIALSLVGALLLLFICHLAWILWMSPGTPCSCGGLFEFLSVEYHLLLNIILLFLCILMITSNREIHQGTS